MNGFPEILRTVRVEIEFKNAPEYFDVFPHYKILRGIGQGGYGYVAEAENTKMLEPDGTPCSVAIKKLPAIFRHESLAKSALRELTMLKHFKHENILSISDIIIPLENLLQDNKVVLDPEKLTFADVYIVTDKMELDLDELLVSGTAIEVDQRKFFMYQILKGLKCIHSAQVLHRDLKPQNILVNTACDLKICDFGLARGYDACGMTKNVTTQWYRAPEVLLELLTTDEEMSQYEYAVDIWSAGCIMAELMLRKPLFKGKPHNMDQVEQIFDVIGTPEASEDLPENVRNFLSKRVQKKGLNWTTIFSPDLFEDDERDLVSRMLKFQPSQRISVQDGLEHPYLADFHDPTDEPEAETVYHFPYEDEEDHAVGLFKEFAFFHPEVRQFVPEIP